MMNNTSKLFLAYGIGLIILLFTVSLIFVIAESNINDSQHLSLILTFTGTMGTLLAVALGLIAIAYSIKKANIIIYLGRRTNSNVKVVQEIMVKNTGDALADLAIAFVNIYEPKISPISVSGWEGTSVILTQVQGRKQYMIDHSGHPINLYPSKDMWKSIGFVEIPEGATRNCKFNVSIIGTQGLNRKEFEIKV